MVQDRLALLLLASLASAAPIPIRSVSTALILGPSSSAAGFTFEGDQLMVNTFSTGTPGVNALTWAPLQTAPTVTVLRYGTNNPSRHVGWVARNAGSTLRGTEPPLTPALIARNDLYSVVDNLFVNDGSANSTNIERVDFRFTSPVSARANRSVVVMERGATAGHDAFGIAAILAVDSNGVPTQYGPLLKLAQGWANNSIYTLASGNGQVFYRDVPPGTLVSSATITGQVIAGLMIPLTDLTTLGNAVYGYSLFGNDVATSANLTRPDLFSRTTGAANGGVDLVAMNVGVVQQLPEPQTYLTAGSVLLALALLRCRQNS
jgi:hypothetical protein